MAEDRNRENRDIQNVLVYDRNSQGNKRLLANLATIQTGLNGSVVHLVGVDRYKALAGDTGAAEHLSQEPLPYRALVVVGGSPHETDVLEFAELVFGEIGLARVVYLCQKGIPRQDLTVKGMTTLELQRRDGYLTHHDAERLVTILQSHA